VAIVNTGLCNLDSIARAVEECASSPVVTDDPDDLVTATHIILPGVGAFPAAMARLTERGLVDVMTEHVVGRGIPFLGICLGMQLLGTEGSEIHDTAGLAWIDGEVGLLTPGPGERVPHIGWNEVAPVDDSPLFRGIPPERDFYFVHSYVLRAAKEEDVAARTPYGGGFVSAVQRGLIFGVQFHPEKSQRAGFEVLRNFLSI
jgi:glutamine amidotransferase